MKQTMWIINILMIMVSCNYLPPRTAYKAARIQSDLKIADSFKVLDYTEEYSNTGEGLINIIFQLNDTELEAIIASCKEKKYKEISIDNLVNDGFLNKNPEYGISLYNRNIREIDNGYYRLVTRDLEKLDFGITVLDISKKELIIYVSIP
jgi:hypothetical protein